MFNRIINPAVRSLAQRQRYAALAPTAKRLASYKGAPPPATMDDLPVPCGSWQTQYSTNQAKYNMQLAIGVIFTVVTIIVAKASGLIYLNYSPPSLPKE